MEYTNPKALNLDAVRNSESNVTLGFKCPPELKLTLADEAEKAGLSLSNYVCKLVDFKINKIRLLREENKVLTISLIKVKSDLDFFKNEILFELLEKHKGQSISYYNQEGKKVDMVINSIKDIYILIINSFKYQ